MPPIAKLEIPKADVDLRTQRRGPRTGRFLKQEAISELKKGQTITGINGTDTIWRVTRPGVLKKVRVD